MPRSRSTWLANWLTTDKTLCLHDPIATHTIEDILNLESDKIIGVADTSLYMLGAALNRIKIKKLIVHRQAYQVRRSSGINIDKADLGSIRGMHIEYDQINNNGREIWEYLIGDGFDQERFDILKDMNVQPHFDDMRIQNQEKIRRFVTTVRYIQKNPT